MRKTLLAVTLFSLSLISCYEDGPLMSFRSKQKRICGDWLSKKVINDGHEHEDEGLNRTVTFSSDGQYNDIKGDSVSGIFANRGTWSFTGGHDSLKISVVDEFTGVSHDISWEIKKLAYKEIRLHTTTSSLVTEWWLERKE